MLTVKKAVVIIGGGPAGLAAAVRLRRLGVTDLIILEREQRLGGILRQCIHDGFGLSRFGQTLSGPEYAQRFIDEAQEMNIDHLTEATVLAVTPEKVVTAVTKNGLVQYEAKAVVLAMGCRERTRGAIGIPGSRPAGIYTAGVAQSYINLHNLMVGNDVVILGSGDIGMIMARRLTLEGARVKAVYELQPYPSGLPRNIEQCLNDYDIPLFLSHTIIKVHGASRLTGVTVAQVDAALQPIAGTEKTISCDTLVLSVGLIPENELSEGGGVQLDQRTKGPVVDENYQTSVPGIFSAGNALHVHDLVDFVSLEAEALAGNVAEYIRAGTLPVCCIPVSAGQTVSYTVPQKISGKTDCKLAFRVKTPLKNCRIELRQQDLILATVPLKKALPAEMLHVRLDAKALKTTEGIQVHVR